MQTPTSPEQILLSKIESFIKVSKRASDKQMTEALSQELTGYIKESWFFPLAHQLLTNSQNFSSDKRDKEILISSFVKDKFKYEFESLDIANVESHYRQLCQIAFALRNSSYAAYTNVALALAYTYLHLIALQQYPIENYLSALRPDKPENIKLFNTYFKTLEYIATEVDNTKFVMDQTQRETARQRLNAQQLNVLQMLNLSGVQAFSSGEINKQNILTSFEAWISLHYDVNVVNNIPNHTLFKLIIEHINDEECEEGASNCLRSIIYQLKDPQQNSVMYQALSSCTMQILTLVQNNIKNLQLDKAEDFLRIIADFSRKSINLFIQNYDQNVEAYLTKLIQYLRDDLMNIYETLADFFEDYIHALKQAKKNNVNLNPAIYRITDPLYSAMCYKCQIPSRIMKDLNITDQNKAHHISTAAEQLFKNRQYTDQIFQNLGNLQGKQIYVKMVVDKILAIGSPQQKTFWPNIQSYLYSIIDVIKDYPALDQSLVTLVRIYVQLSNKPEPIPICVRRTYLRVFRSILYLKTKDVQFLYRIMCVAVSCFDQPLLMAVAQKTFCRACEENKSSAVSIFSQFGVVIEKYPNREYIVRGLMIVMCCEGSLITQYLHQVLTFLMKKYKEESDKSLRKEYMYSIVAALKVFKESPLSNQYMNVFLQFTKDVWPYIKQVLGNPQKPKDDEDSDIQRMVRIVKVIMRNLQFGFSEFLEDLFTTVLAAFQKYPICSYVYLVQVAVTVYAKNPAYNDYLQRLYSSFCDIAFQHMHRIEEIGRFSYLLDDFMGMNKRFFLHNASIVLSSGKLSSIIDLAINGFMGCDIPRVAKAAYSFFQTIFIVYWPADFLKVRNTEQDITPFKPLIEDSQYYQALKEYLLQRLEHIIAKMLTHLSSAPTEQTRDYILDALLSEIKGFITENPAIWASLLIKLPSEILVQKQKERMVELMQSLQGAAYEVAKGIVKSLDKMLVLMNQRLVNASKRKVIIF